MTKLLSTQKRLNAVLRKQARLLKVAVAEVRSTEAEWLRMVNQALLDASPSVKGVKNPFLDRNLTDVQLLAEDMIRRQGRKRIGGEPMRKPSRPSSRSYTSRRKWVERTEKLCSIQPAPSDILSLRGPLVADFRRSVEKGYAGSPAQWLRTAKTRVRIERLVQKGITLRLPEYSIFDRRSPLHWMVNSHSGCRTNRLHGFQGERLRGRATNFVTLQRQSLSVKRLRVNDWPRSKDGGLAWPCYPTLAESWEMLHRKKVPMHHHFTSLADSGIARSHKVPTKRVLPGSSARAVSNFVIGIRADIEVPRKFLGFFCYRWGFLILKRLGYLPRLLVKLIARLWKEDVFSLWLKHPIRYNEALRRIPATKYYSMAGFHPGGTAPGTGKCRRRPGKWDRLRSSIEVMDLPVKREGSPSSDKSGGGVRLF